MQDAISKSKNVAPRSRGWLKGVAAILTLGLGLTAGLASQVAQADTASPVVRFYNEHTGTHFYTIDSAERDNVLRLYPWFDYEGVQFYAYKTQVAGSTPVYRFFNTATGTHFYTIVPAEKDYVIAHFQSYIFEGAVYYAMSSPVAGSEDLYRFYNTVTGAHFYTTSAPERDHVKATWPWFNFEGVAYQVFADPSQAGGGGGQPTATTLFSSANPANAGASVTFVATVTGAAPSGTFTFTDNGAALSGCNAVGVGVSGNNGTSICTTTTLAVGNHTIVANYSGNGANAASSDSLVQVVNGGGGGSGATTTTVTSSVNPAGVGSTVTFTASVSGNAPTGSVSFTDSGANIGCAAVTLGGGTATCSTSSLTQGTHTIIASYGGDTGNMGSSGMVAEVVNGSGGGPTTSVTGLVSSANPAAAGAGVTFTASVTGNLPTGTVTFTENGASIGCGAVSVTRSSAACTTASLTQGTHNILASYSGDANNMASSGTVAQVITGGGGGGGQGATTTSVVSSANPSAVGAPVTFTATVTGNLVTGTISFTERGASIGCAAVTIARSTAACTTAALGQGTHTIVATYSGDSGNLTSNGSVSQVVGSGGGGSGAVTLTSSANPAASGTSVTFTATVTGTAPTGSVNFMDGTTSISNCAVVNFAAGSGNTRTAACTTTTLSVATHSITAKYSGDVSNPTATSAVLSESITGTPPALVPTVAFNVSNTLINAAQTVTITATATEAGGSIRNVSLFVDGTMVASLAAAPYTFTTAALAAGTHVIYATATDALGTVASTLTQDVVALSGAPAVASTNPDFWRLLNQATFGASQAEVANVKAMGISAWIDNQFTKPISGYPDTKYNQITLKSTLTCNTNDPAGKAYPANSPQAICARDHLTLAGIQRDFFTNAITAPDQLRQRVAWALSQITVTSGNDPDLSFAYPMSRYQNIMFNNAFGNYQTLLQQITLSPAMGYYLTMVNNDRASGARVPNENYAREIMQLFSIGLEELNDDGSVIKDVAGVPVPTYDQNVIKEFAKIFTGYTYADPVNPTAAATKKNAPYYAANMVTYPTTANSGHETSQKTLLPLVGGTVIPPNQTPQQDLDSAVLNVFMHASTPAYIGRQLIQRLVTGNPSPAYMTRISAVFKNNGSGVRGDLKAVVKAILMDPEARGAGNPDPTFGNLREPVLAVTAAIRALNGITDGNRLAAATSNLSQNPYFSPTVFNYFPPDATLPGSAALAPEFAIHTTNTAVARSNLIYTLVYGGYAPDPTIQDSTGTKLDLSQFVALATTPAAMVSRLSDVLTGGQLDAAAQTIVTNAVTAVVVSATPTAAQLMARAQMGAYLVLSSFHFQVQR